MLVTITEFLIQKGNNSVIFECLYNHAITAINTLPLQSKMMSEFIDAIKADGSFETCPLTDEEAMSIALDLNDGYAWIESRYESPEPFRPKITADVTPNEWKLLLEHYKYPDYVGNMDGYEQLFHDVMTVIKDPLLDTMGRCIVRVMYESVNRISGKVIYNSVKYVLNDCRELPHLIRETRLTIPQFSDYDQELYGFRVNFYTPVTLKQQY